LWELKNLAMYETVAQGGGVLDSNSCVDLDFPLDNISDHGKYAFRIQINGVSTGQCRIQIADFTPPTFEVESSFSASDNRFGPISGSVSGKYLTGVPLSKALVRTIVAPTLSYNNRPPVQSKVKPPTGALDWTYTDFDSSSRWPSWERIQYDSVLNDNGFAQVTVNRNCAEHCNFPVNYTVQHMVQNKDGKWQSAPASSFLSYPWVHMVGLTTKSVNVPISEIDSTKMPIYVIVNDLEGNLVSAKVQLTIKVSQNAGDSSTSKEIRSISLTITTDSKQPFFYDLDQLSTSYVTIKAQVTDPFGKTHKASTSAYVSTQSPPAEKPAAQAAIDEKEAESRFIFHNST